MNRSLCDGCGACMEVCPTHALYLADGKAEVDETLCRACEACCAACPIQAIRLVTQDEPEAEPAPLPTLRREPEVVQIKTRPAPTPFRSRVLPVIGAALVWAGREMLPRLAESFLYDLGQRLPQGQSPSTRQRLSSKDKVGRGRGRGRRRRRRRGGGG
ncbi:MAG: 4Fe-4S binding protein [Anaerolineae bacterium]